jgi:hypothetical protein
MRTSLRNAVIASSVLAAAGLLSAQVLANSFADVDASTHVSQSVQLLEDRGLVQGYADGTYRPSQLVNRAEFLKVLMGAAAVDVSGIAEPCFADFNGPAQWFWATSCAAKSLGIVNGYPDGTFRGEVTVNEAEGLKMAVGAFGLPLPQYIRAPDHWYEPYFIAANETHVFDWLPNDPSRKLTRADMAEIVAAFLGEQSSSTQCSGGHQLGDNYPSPDGCNTCSCTEFGDACTLRACAAPTSCTSDNQCGGGQVCSTRYGDCQSACPPGAQFCTQVCAGTCVNPR